MLMRILSQLPTLISPLHSQEEGHRHRPEGRPHRERNRRQPHGQHQGRRAVPLGRAHAYRGMSVTPGVCWSPRGVSVTPGYVGHPTGVRCQYGDSVVGFVHIVVEI